VISANTASAAARAIRRGHEEGTGHDAGDACAELADRLAREAEAAVFARQRIGIIDTEPAEAVRLVCGVHMYAVEGIAPPADTVIEGYAVCEDHAGLVAQGERFAGILAAARMMR
jgi:hypothetical protein